MQEEKNSEQIGSNAMSKVLYATSMLVGFCALLLVVALVVSESVASPPSRTIYYDLSSDPKTIHELPDGVQGIIRPLLRSKGTAVVVIMPECTSCSAKNIPEMLRDVRSAFGDSAVVAWPPDSLSQAAKGLKLRQLQLSASDLEAMHVPFTPRAYACLPNGNLQCQLPLQGFAAFKGTLP